MFKRKPRARKTEAKRATKVYNQYSDKDEDIKNRLGISSSAPREKIIFELNKVKHKENLRKILKLTDADFKEYGIE